tara:strand:+ start:14348 stop:15838 length:1491 start_codon:yes stop_codon:yes gene_type:complete
MRPLDIAVIILYLIGVVWAGLASRGKKGDSEEFFTSKGAFTGRLGMIMVGFSMAATLFSGVSYVIYTSVGFSSGAGIVMGMLGFPLTWALLRFWFLPRYLAGGGNHPYDIIEERLGTPVRLCLSAMFILLRIGWMAAILVAPTLVLIGATGLDDSWFWPIVISIGVTCTAYTAIGGIRSVIVTDAIQFCIMALGMAFIIGFILHKLDLPIGEIYAQLDVGERLNLFNFSFDLTVDLTFWTVVIGLMIGNLGSYTADLMMLQRYHAAESPQAAAKAFAVNTWGVIIVCVLLVSAGLLLWVWFQNHPDPNLPENADQALAYFITTELPPGIAGLLIATILAATMSSMTSGIIALAGTLTNDWLQRFGRPRTPAELMRFGRYATVGVGVLAMAAAGFATLMGSLFQSTQAIMGAFFGPMVGCMMIVVNKWQIRPMGVLLGMGLGTVAGWSIAFSPVSNLWVATGSLIVTLGVSFCFRRRPAERDFDGHVRRKPSDAASD